MKNEPWAIDSRPANDSLANYEIDCPIGRGSHSVVYKAVHRKSGKTVALKVIETRSQAERERVRREVRIHRSLEHPRIVRLLSWFRDELSYYLVLEYCAKGEFYAMFVREKKFCESAVREYAKQVLTGLAYLHGQGVIHRDVKMGNLLVDEKGELKLADFGLSVLFEERAEVGNEAAVGTPNYLPPEFVQRNKVSFANDIWAVGCFAYALKFGKLPFEGDDHQTTLKNIVRREPHFSGDCSAELLSLLKALLDKEYENRRSAKKMLSMKFFQISNEETANEKSGRSWADSTIATLSQPMSFDTSKCVSGTTLGWQKQAQHASLTSCTETFKFDAKQRILSTTVGRIRAASLKKPAQPIPAQKTPGWGACQTLSVFSELRTGGRQKAQSIVKTRLNMHKIFESLNQKFSDSNE